MSRFIDLTNKRFDNLLVLNREKDYISANGTHYAQWKCLCDCGNLINVLGTNLKSKKTKSCGCLRSKTISIQNKNTILMTY